MLEKKKSFFGKLKENIENTFTGRPKIDDSLLDELEEVLILSDIGLMTTSKIIETLKENIKQKRIEDSDSVKTEITDIIYGLVDKGEQIKMKDEYPLLVLCIGVNGTGKTTTIAKLANYYKNKNKSVVLVAGDTFRAAATEQINIWANKLELPIVKRSEGEDPGAVLYDAIKYIKESPKDVIIVDTAGRLQTKKNLMAELGKMDKIIEKNFPSLERENLLILDATTGKNAVSQAKEFNEVTNLTGLVLTKTDGTTKGGVAITVTDEFNVPIKFLGIGEKLEDIKEFSPAEFSESIFA